MRHAAIAFGIFVSAAALVEAACSTGGGVTIVHTTTVDPDLPGEGVTAIPPTDPGAMVFPPTDSTADAEAGAQDSSDGDAGPVYVVIDEAGAEAGD